VQVLPFQVWPPVQELTQLEPFQVVPAAQEAVDESAAVLLPYAFVAFAVQVVVPGAEAAMVPEPEVSGDRAPVIEVAPVQVKLRELAPETFQASV